MVDAAHPDPLGHANDGLTEAEEVIACLGDDAAALRDENPESEVAANMDKAIRLLERAYGVGAVDLARQWKDVYAAFKGAFDTPQMRRQMPDEYSTDARRRLREFDEAMSAHGVREVDASHEQLMRYIERNIEAAKSINDTDMARWWEARRAEYADGVDLPHGAKR